MWHFWVVYIYMYHGISHKTPVFSFWYTYKHLGRYCKKIQVISAIFRGIYHERELHNYFIAYSGQHSQWETCAAHDGKVGCITIQYTTYSFPLFRLAVFSMAFYKILYYDNGYLISYKLFSCCLYNPLH